MPDAGVNTAMWHLRARTYASKKEPWTPRNFDRFHGMSRPRARTRPTTFAHYDFQEVKRMQHTG